MGHYSASPGAIYPALKRLEAQGLIEGVVDATRSMRPKRVFSPTARGTEIFREWLSREVTAEDVIWRLDELMLRFAFHSFLDDNRATLAFLIAFERGVLRYIEVLADQVHELPETVPIHGRLALESGVESYQAHARWIRRALMYFEEASA